MKFKSLFFAGALALASLSMASAKSYSITLRESATAGTVQLAAGEYNVKVDGANAIFTNVDTGKSVTTPVKVENTGKKHNETALDTSSGTGTTKLDAIELGGTDETLEF
jgi:hypothetical protein